MLSTIESLKPPFCNDVIKASKVEVFRVALTAKQGSLIVAAFLPVKERVYGDTQKVKPAFLSSTSPGLRSGITQVINHEKDYGLCEVDDARKRISTITFCKTYLVSRHCTQWKC